MLEHGESLQGCMILSGFSKANELFVFSHTVTQMKLITGIFSNQNYRYDTSIWVWNINWSIQLCFFDIECIDNCKRCDVDNEKCEECIDDYKNNPEKTKCVRKFFIFLASDIQYWHYVLCFCSTCLFYLVCNWNDMYLSLMKEVYGK